VALVALLIFVPLNANAAQTFTGVINAVTSASPAPTSAPYSTPVLQDYDQISVQAGPGVTIAASLSYTDSSGGTAGGNDLDLTLLLPSSAPIPVITDPTNPAFIPFVQAVAASRVTRAACIDAAAESDNKPLLGEGAGESLSFTVPAGGETGTYALLVRGFLVTADQAYSLDVSVADADGRDITAGSAVKILTSTIITTNPHCELI
jgi:hypothetical protein